MSKFLYTGKDNFAVKHGEVLEGELTTWSFKKPNSNERETVQCFYGNVFDFEGRQIPIHGSLLKQI